MKLTPILTAALIAAVVSTRPAAAQAIELGFALHTSPPGPEFAAVDKFSELVQKRSEGKIKVKTFPSAVLGGERDNIEQLTVNQVAMTLNGDLLPNVSAPQYAATVVPFVFPSAEAVYEYWASPIGEKAKEAIRGKVGIEVVAFMRRGDRHLSAKKAINAPADIKGVKLRVPEIPSWVRAWTAVGARPTPVAWPEVFSALQMGVVDAQENPCFNINQAKLYEVQQYLIYTAHIPAVWHWSISKKFLDGLTPELRTAVIESAAEAAKFGDELTKSEIDKVCDELVSKHKMTAVKPDRAAFVAAARPAIDELAKAWAPGVLEAVSKHLN
jgi:tripartite ATP-independent transporter DctP family solute receptor